MSEAMNVPDHLKQVEAGPSTWAEVRDLKPRDRKLRIAGCKIEHRRRGAEPVWSHPKLGKMTQSKMEAALFAEAKKEVAAFVGAEKGTA
jgi:hypothetical protein